MGSFDALERSPECSLNGIRCANQASRRLAKFSFSKPPGIRNGFAVNRC